EKYCGSNVGNRGGVSARPEGAYWMPYSLSVTVPPLGAVIFKPKFDKKPEAAKAAAVEAAPAAEPVKAEEAPAKKTRKTTAKKKQA
ncbi:MAG: hypothetical protein II707_03520, partial [Spirochaetales bacterium]|nr:hypothetical protein [Spirochaetales bacterium]